MLTLTGSPNAFSQIPTDSHWRIDAQLGLGYDSQVLYNPDLDLSTASPLPGNGGMRGFLAANARRRFAQGERSRLYGSWGFESFHSKSDRYVQGDELVQKISMTHLTHWDGENKFLMITPGVQSTHLDFDRSEKLSNTLFSRFVNTVYSLNVSPTWATLANLNYQYDESNLPGISNNSQINADATVIEFIKSERFYTSRSQDHVLQIDLGFRDNRARGSEEKYSRYELGVAYQTQYADLARMDWGLEARANSIDFNERLDGREDIRYKLHGHIKKPLSEVWLWGLSVDFTENHSSLDEYEYSRTESYLSLAYRWDK